MTSIGIMQPYFFPYIGHFQLMLAVDRWIVFDVVKYNRRSWMNRNRILHPNGGWQYVSVPVHAHHGASIAAAIVADRLGTRRRILGQLEHYRGKAPFFSTVCDMVSEAFTSVQTDRLCELNVRALALVCDYLGIAFDWSVCSDLGVDLASVAHAGQWALEICTALKASRYVNPLSGQHLFHPHEWHDRRIELMFVNPVGYMYRCGPYQHIENLSVLDVLMWNDKQSIVEHMTSSIRRQLDPQGEVGSMPS